MGKASNRKKATKAASANTFDSLAFTLNMNEIYEQFLRTRRYEASTALYSAVAEHDFEKVKELLEELEGLGGNIYNERFIVQTDNGEQKVDILQAALMFEDEEIFLYVAMDAVSKNSLNDRWNSIIYEAPDASYLSPVRLKMMNKFFDAFLRHYDLLNTAPSIIEDMKAKMGPNALGIFDQVIGEKQAKFEKAELLELIPKAEEESANEEAIVPRRRSNSLRM